MRVIHLKYLVIVLSSLGMVACGDAPGSSEEFLNEVKETDRSFSRMSEEQGMAKAFIEYADESVIRLNNNQFPTVGKDELVKAMTPEDGNGKLTWEPLMGNVDGGMGYTFGDWKMELTMNGRDTVLFGNYVTIWRKQRDGKWKFVLDGGNPTPGPTPSNLKERINQLK